MSLWTHSNKGTLLAAGNITDEASSVTLAMPPHSFALVWVNELFAQHMKREDAR